MKDVEAQIQDAIVTQVGMICCVTRFVARLTREGVQHQPGPHERCGGADIAIVTGGHSLFYNT
jgi:hypothetical protein